MKEENLEPNVEVFKGVLLDEQLSLGYFRMLYTLFTTHCIPNGKYGNGILMMPVFWLRTLVKQVIKSGSALSIQKKCAIFHVTVKEAVVTDEIENLYSLYVNQLKFESSNTCKGRFGTDIFDNQFDSWMIEIRDGEKLIAVGYFDRGLKSIMGILNIYHPDYKKYSLGKFLMLQKIDFALANDIDYYYTGYIGTDVDNFDYKTFPDINSVEVFLPLEKEWKPYIQFNKNQLRNYFECNLLGIDDIEINNNFL